MNAPETTEEEERYWIEGFEKETRGKQEERRRRREGEEFFLKGFEEDFTYEGFEEVFSFVGFGKGADAGEERE